MIGKAAKLRVHLTGYPAAEVAIAKIYAISELSASTLAHIDPLIFCTINIGYCVSCTRGVFSLTYTH